MSERDLMITAYQIQDASNIRAVTNFLLKVLDELPRGQEIIQVGEVYPDDDPRWNHPAVIILIDKLMSLCRIQADNQKIWDAMSLCGDEERRKLERAVGEN